MATLRDEGFTLMEVLLALGLFVVVMGSLPSVILSNSHANAFARRVTTAVGMAQDEIEVIRAMRYVDVVDGADNPTDPTDATVYTRTWTVSDGPTDSTRVVAVVVSWTDQTPSQVEIDAIIGS